MSADLLKRAADKLRVALAADYLTDGPWDCLDLGDRIVHIESASGAMEYVVDEPVTNASNAEYIALLHPPVALALAAWLEATAERIETLRPVLTRPREYTPEGYAAHIEKTYAHPLAVARAILRELPDRQEIDRRLSEGPSYPGGIQL